MIYVLLSRNQAGLGRTVKQEQEEISRNHIRSYISDSVARGGSLMLKQLTALPMLSFPASGDPGPEPFWELYFHLQM